MEELVKKIQALRDLVKALKKPAQPKLPSIPSIKQPSPPSMTPKKPKQPKLPGITPNGKKDPKKIAQQLKEGQLSNKNVEMLKVEKNGQWRLEQYNSLVKKKPPYNQNAVIRGALRRAFARSPLVVEKMQESRREVPRFNKDGTRAKKNWVQRQCEVCQNWVGSTKITIDHIDPVISVDDGFQDWNEFVARLWCDKSNLQRICDDCHDKKTAKERFERMYHNELTLLNDLTSGTGAPKDTVKKFVKKFTKKRIEKFPYPQEFKDRIRNLRRFVGMKV